MPNETRQLRTHIARIAAICLIAAAVQAIFVVIQTGPPHFGWGPLVFGTTFIFWTFPPMTIYRLLVGSDIPHLPMSLVWFAVALFIATCVFYRSEIYAILKRANANTGV